MENKIAVYTALFGNYSGIIEQPKIKDVDYICYTDQDITSDSWKVIKVSPPIEGDNTRSNRYYKLLPHKHLKGYKTSVYIDANYLILDDFSSMVTEKLKENSMVCFDHNQTELDKRDCLYEEHNELVKIATHLNIYRDSLESMQEQIDFFKEEKYPKNNGLIFAAVLIRKHHDKDVIALMELWWSFVKNKSRRDQLSFNYCVWKLNFNKLEYLKGDLRAGNPWFYWIDHKLDFEKDIKRIKRRKKLEKILSVSLVKFIYNFIPTILYLPTSIYTLSKTPYWFKNIKSRKITPTEYTSLRKEILTKRLSKQEIKNLIGKI